LQTLANYRLAFIGAGNMASSLIQGLLRDGAIANNISVADPMAEQRDKLGELGVNTFADNDAAIASADAIVIAVKPQVAQTVLTDLQTLGSEQLMVSIAAGINLTSLSNWTDPAQPIVRCMPNTPALLGEGMSALYANEHCSDIQRKLAEGILNAAGETLWVTDEKALDAVTAVSGSGPAYFFLLMEAMIDAGVALGLERAIATQLTLQTALGAALMAKTSDDPPAILRQNVTSPGGTTEAALQVMTEQGLGETISAALKAADNRASELAEEFGGSLS
jgi:pyrroline-5-carboxylate reductase